MGVGLSSNATEQEVRDLVETALGHHRLALHDVTTIATRSRFAQDHRLRLGPPVIGYSDSVLEERSAPCDRTTGIRARVAETAALLASGVDPASVAPAMRSAHVTVAVVVL